ncbi:TetR/AcrR family transcriptional regulator [Neokomagataea anthophila]|uniref:TetR/AcrR family transcriptional regulator n=1 Tax=Neokomagataea anthophila TaxID=2826925 RepID=A0ABS5E8V7_9PROT|nr:TetR/AcrR family transcriptional regulator [Neokomagataea anthophila]MBR0560316.1 TetR/AcrR family transcriptional regulator [Neokomagataea anthophila]
MRNQRGTKTPCQTPTTPSAPSPHSLSGKREQILRGAEKVFLAHGYEGASMSHIAREAGVSKGTLYNHFTSKADLFSAFIIEQSRTKLQTLTALVNDDAHDLQSTLLNVCEAAIHLLLNPEAMGLYRILVAETEKFPNLADTFWKHSFGATVNNLSQWLQRCHDTGMLAIPDVEFAAEQLIAMCQTRIINRRRLAMPVDDSSKAITRLAQLTAESFWKIYAPH